jgi:hypothetical protein
MSRYPLEWGWHTDEPTQVSAKSEPSSVEASPGRKPKEEGDFDVAAKGDRLCANHPRKSGQTGAYEVEGRILCRDCAVKRLGFEDMPSNEQTVAMVPWCLRPK